MIIGWMLTRMVVLRFVMILFGISVFVITLDVATYVDEILKRNDGQLSSLAHYAFLRLPGTLSTFMAISVLLALLLTLMELSYHSETTAIWASGTSPLGVIVKLLPIGVVLGAINFAINDRAVPTVAPVLHAWGIGDYGNKQLNIGEKDPIWMRSGNDILRAADSNPQSTELENIVIFRRSLEGILVEQIMAERARLVDGRWELTNVIVYYQENLPPNRLATLIYSGTLRPAAAGARSGDPEEMTIGDLDYFIANSGFGIRPAHVYETWWHKRITLFVSAWLMIGICVPLAARFRRGGGIGFLFFVGVALGFVFFVLDGISLTMGELGLVPPWMAAWLPIFIFAGIASSMVLRAETIG